MFEQLYKSIHAHVTLTPEEWEFCKTKFIPKRLRRRQYLLQQGDVCRKLAFIEKGAVVAYTIDDKGTQKVIQFGFEGWWIADLYSFLTNEPSALNIEALEDSELLLIDKVEHEELMEQVHAIGNYHRILFQNAFIALQRRVGNTIGTTAGEKYNTLVEEFPASFFNRIPQHLIASYLGVTPETLSRVRNQRASQRD
ncbi:MAG TPA: Crp/Fnr family transcriptional regulator [Balneolaceae bacterium]|nr:Crp/Fnr family transcriptional regulator [Balneolaceae bacterium]